MYLIVNKSLDTLRGIESKALPKLVTNNGGISIISPHHNDMTTRHALLTKSACRFSPRSYFDPNMADACHVHIRIHGSAVVPIACSVLAASPFALGLVYGPALSVDRAKIRNANQSRARAQRVASVEPKLRRKESPDVRITVNSSGHLGTAMVSGLVFSAQ